jgi:hypothetical protein
VPYLSHSLLAIHDRHRQVEQHQIHPPGQAFKLLQTIPTVLGEGHGVAVLFQAVPGHPAHRILVVYHQHQAIPARRFSGGSALNCRGRPGGGGKEDGEGGAFAGRTGQLEDRVVWCVLNDQAIVGVVHVQLAA